MDTDATAKTVVTLEAVVFRADGTVEDLGVIASSDAGTLELARELHTAAVGWRGVQDG